MQGKAAQGSSADRASGAANEEFTPDTGGAEAPPRRAGWDPFQVWQTRVKASPPKPKERERERKPRR